MKNEIHNHDEYGCIRIFMYWYCYYFYYHTRIVMKPFWWILLFCHVSFWWRAHTGGPGVYSKRDFASSREKNQNNVDEFPFLATQDLVHKVTGRGFNHCCRAHLFESDKEAFTSSPAYSTLHDVAGTGGWIRCDTGCWKWKKKRNAWLEHTNLLLSLNANSTLHDDFHLLKGCVLFLSVYWDTSEILQSVCSLPTLRLVWPC